MKSLKYLSLIICSLFMASCDKETEGVSNANKLFFEMQGEETMLVTLGTSYNEPGYKASFNGTDVTGEIKVYGDEVDAETVGLYTKEYAYYNRDNVKTSLFRTVIVCDPAVEADMSGEYITVSGTQVETNTGRIIPYDDYDIEISKIAPGFFQISDFIGGFYAQYYGYGGAYAIKGYVQLLNDGTFNFLSGSSSITPWGDTISGIEDGIYDSATGNVSWVASYGSPKFKVLLNPKEED